jgi:hypothetical protein
MLGAAMDSTAGTAIRHQCPALTRSTPPRATVNVTRAMLATDKALARKVHGPISESAIFTAGQLRPHRMPSRSTRAICPRVGVCCIDKAVEAAHRGCKPCAGYLDGEDGAM